MVAFSFDAPVVSEVLPARTALAFFSTPARIQVGDELHETILMLARWSEDDAWPLVYCDTLIVVDGKPSLKRRRLWFKFAWQNLNDPSLVVAPPWMVRELAKMHHIPSEVTRLAAYLSTLNIPTPKEAIR